MTRNVNDWLASPSAEKFFNQEKQSFERLSSVLCGQIGVQLTMSEKNNYIADINVSSALYLLQQHRSSANTVASVQESNQVVADLEALPFASNQFAVVVVPQMNLFSIDPYAALREIYRITASDGIVMISGMNLFSLIGFQAKLFPTKFPFLPTVSQGQMKEWLTLLGCEIIGGDLFHYSALVNKPRKKALGQKIEKIGNRWMPMMAGGYWLLARKRLFGQMVTKPYSFSRYKAGKIGQQVATNSNSKRQHECLQKKL